MTKVYHSSQKDDWETPPDLFGVLDLEFGFTLDVCASPENTKVEKFFSVDDDGLQQDWGGHDCFMNPPYSQTAKWLAKAAMEGKKLSTTVVCLIAARTDTRVWHDIVWKQAREIRFLKGRVKFVGGTASAPFPSAVVIFQKHCVDDMVDVWGWDWKKEPAYDKQGFAQKTCRENEKESP